MREGIYTTGFSHSNPIPAACRLGNLVVTGIINGLDPAAREPGSFDEQCALMFERVREVMAAAGGSVDHIAKLNIQIADIAQRALLNSHWVAMFPDPNTRPVRQTTELPLDRGKLIQCDVLAWLEPSNN